MKIVFNITIENTKNKQGLKKYKNYKKCELPSKNYFYINNKSGVYTNKYIFKNKFFGDFGK